MHSDTTLFQSSQLFWIWGWVFPSCCCFVW